MATTSNDRLTRSRDDRLVGGVAGGLGAYLGIDPALVRVGFVLLAVFGGSGVVLYLALWLLLPPDDDAARPVDANLRAVVGEMRSAADGLAQGVRSGWRREDRTAGDGETGTGDAETAEAVDAGEGDTHQDPSATPVA